MDAGITWMELASVATFLSIVIGAITTWNWRIVKSLKDNLAESEASLKKEVADNRKVIEDNRFESVHTYASIRAVTEIENRLTNSINRMSDQMMISINHLTDRLEKALINKQGG